MKILKLKNLKATNYLTKFDGLRGFFCLLVLIQHYHIFNLPPYISDSNFRYLSFIFVDYFFVLSGFVISLNYQFKLNTFNNLKEYLLKRFLRLYPLLFYTSIVYLFLLFLFEGFKNNYLTSFFSDIFFTSSFGLIPDDASVNGITWSISSEIINYLLFGILFYSVRKNSNRHLIILLVLFIILIYFKSLNEILFFSTHALGWLRGLLGFFIGYFSQFLHRICSKKLPHIFEYLFIIGLLYIFTFENYLTYPLNNLFLSIFILAYFGLGLFILANTNGILSKILESNLFSFIGKISYSIYLNHMLILNFVMKPILDKLRLEDNLLNQWSVLISTLLICIIYSNLTYSLIEMKFINYFRKFLRK